MLKYQQHSPSLLQLAVDDRIFVIDLLSKEEGFAEDAISRFIGEVCQNTKVLKVSLIDTDWTRP
jgi:hypothetical protein